MSTIDTKAESVLSLLQKQWGLDLPKLILTVHGGMANFDLSPKMKRSFRKGLVKFAKTTGAWVFTSGIKTGDFKEERTFFLMETVCMRNKLHNI